MCIWRGGSHPRRLRLWLSARTASPHHNPCTHLPFCRCAPAAGMVQPAPGAGSRDSGGGGECRGRRARAAPGKPPLSTAAIATASTLPVPGSMRRAAGRVVRGCWLTQRAAAPALPLPCLQLVTAGDPALWLHLADEAMRFEKRWAVQGCTGWQYSLYRNALLPCCPVALLPCCPVPLPLLSHARVFYLPCSEFLPPSACNAPSQLLTTHAQSPAVCPRCSRRFAPLRGASLALPEEEDFLAAGHAGSTIELLFGRPEWQASWLACLPTCPPVLCACLCGGLLLRILVWLGCLHSIHPATCTYLPRLSSTAGGLAGRRAVGCLPPAGCRLRGLHRLAARRGAAAGGGRAGGGGHGTGDAAQQVRIRWTPGLLGLMLHGWLLPPCMHAVSEAGLMVLLMYHPCSHPLSCRAGGGAWRREFWPPVCAEQVSSLVGGLVRRGGWAHQQAHKLQYVQAVPLAILRAFRERLNGLLLQAEQFRCACMWLGKGGRALSCTVLWSRSPRPVSGCPVLPHTALQRVS
jgi:hypothetical protein